MQTISCGPNQWSVAPAVLHPRIASPVQQEGDQILKAISACNMQGRLAQLESGGKLIRKTGGGEKMIHQKKQKTKSKVC
jgi:hypothetical protein